MFDNITHIAISKLGHFSKEPLVMLRCITSLQTLPLHIIERLKCYELEIQSNPRNYSNGQIVVCCCEPDCRRLGP